MCVEVNVFCVQKWMCCVKCVHLNLLLVAILVQVNAYGCVVCLGGQRWMFCGFGCGYVACMCVHMDVLLVVVLDAGV